MPACNLSNFDIKKRGKGRSEKRKALFYRNLGIFIDIEKCSIKVVLYHL